VPFEKEAIVTLEHQREDFPQSFHLVAALLCQEIRYLCKLVQVLHGCRHIRRRTDNLPEIVGMEAYVSIPRAGEAHEANDL